MPKFKELINLPPEPEGGAEEQLAALRDYLVKIIQELQYLLSHLEPDNINDDVFQQIYRKIPQPYGGLPLMDGAASSGGSGNWARGDHRHPSDTSKADASALAAVADDLEDTDAALAAHVTNTGNPHEVTKAQVGLGDVANERQYSAQNPPPIPTPGEVGAIPVTEKGSAGGVAELDNSGHVPSSQLPSYVDDVKEYPSVTDFPIPGESDKIYIALDTDLFYRWGGTVYAPTNPSLALGETSSTAYRGDRGKAAYDHSQLTSGNPHNVTAAEVGLGNVDNVQQYSVQNPPPLPTPADIGAATAQDLADHVGDTANPHSVTAAQVGLGNVDNVQQYSASNPPPYPVTSVNGGTGAVTLDASDVGARPDTWTPSKSDIGLGNVADERQYSANNPPPAPDAEDVPYDNTQSGIAATDVQAAIDEIAQGGGGGPSPSDANPQMDRTAAPGTATTYSRGDHVHPSDTSKANQAQLATVESGSTASRAYVVGEYFCWGGVLYRATAAISNGGSFTPGTNCEAVTVGGELQSLASTVKTFEVTPGHSLQISIPDNATRLQCLLASSGARATTSILYFLSLYSANSNYHRINSIITGSSISVSDSAGTTTITNNHASDTVTFIVLTLNSTGTVNYTVV